MSSSPDNTFRGDDTDGTKSDGVGSEQVNAGTSSCLESEKVGGTRDTGIKRPRSQPEEIEKGSHPDKVVILEDCNEAGRPVSLESSSADSGPDLSESPPKTKRTVKEAILIEDHGEGYEVRRSIGGAKLRLFDPFVLVDEVRIKLPTGFRNHPHRGVDTVTYVLEGRSIHRDFRGHKGSIEPGGLQWMTAGRGIVHTELPDPEAYGLHLWINLKKELKMCEPAYQELGSEDIPKRSKDGVSVKVVAGESLGAKSEIYTRTPTIFLDFQLDPGAKHEQDVPKGWNCFVYTLSGVAKISGVEVNRHHTIVLKDGDFVTLANDSNEKSHFVLLAGEPLNEPVVQHSTLVMNTQADMIDTIRDYQNGVNGFENANSWSDSE